LAATLHATFKPLFALLHKHALPFVFDDFWISLGFPAGFQLFFASKVTVTNDHIGLCHKNYNPKGLPEF